MSRATPWLLRSEMKTRISVFVFGVSTALCTSANAAAPTTDAIRGVSRAVKSFPQDTRRPWRDFLSGVASLEGVRIVFDVDPKVRPPALDWRSRRGKSGLRMLAWLTGRKWVHRDGVEVFVQQDGAERALDLSGTTLMTWLRTLHQDDASDLVNAKFPLRRLDEATREGILRTAMEVAPSLGNIFLDRLPNIGVAASVVPVIRWVDERSGQNHFCAIPTTLPSVVIDAPPSQGEHPVIQNESVGNGDGPATPQGAAQLTGPLLNLAAGRVLPLRELASLASAAFAGSYDFDSRLSETTYFIQGTFDAAKFESAAKTVTSARPFERVQTPNSNHRDEIRNLLSNELRDLLNRPVRTGGWGPLTIGSEFMGEGLVPLSVLFGDNTGLMQYLLNGSQQGLTAQTAVQCTLGLNLQVDAGGWTNVGILINGKSSDAFGPNQVNFVLL